jgi:hypothetical protein
MLNWRPRSALAIAERNPAWLLSASCTLVAHSGLRKVTDMFDSYFDNDLKNATT